MGFADLLRDNTASVDKVIEDNVYKNAKNILEEVKKKRKKLLQ